MIYSYGWKPEFEDRHDVTAITSDARCSASDAPIPEEYDIPSWVQDDQRARPFCHAHMRTGAEELLAFLATGDLISYSRYFAAITNMRMDGDDRFEEGASIKGSCLSAIKDGACLESLKPYLKDNERYSNRIDPEVVKNAKLHHIKSMTKSIRSYDEMDSLMITGRYVIAFGLDWTQELAAIRGVDVHDAAPGRSGILGGHAVLAFGWTTRKGSRYHKLHNSHDGFGVKRRVAMSPKWWDVTLKNSRFGAFGLSDIALDDFTPVPRPLSFKKKPIQL